MAEDPTIKRIDKIEEAMDEFLREDGSFLFDDDHRVYTEMYDLLSGLRRSIQSGE